MSKVVQICTICAPKNNSLGGIMPHEPLCTDLQVTQPTQTRLISTLAIKNVSFEYEGVGLESGFLT